MEILGLHPGPTERETLGVGPIDPFQQSPQEFRVHIQVQESLASAVAVLITPFAESVLPLRYYLLQVFSLNGRFNI